MISLTFYNNLVRNVMSLLDGEKINNEHYIKSVHSTLSGFFRSWMTVMKQFKRYVSDTKHLFEIILTIRLSVANKVALKIIIQINNFRQNV